MSIAAASMQTESSLLAKAKAALNTQADDQAKQKKELRQACCMFEAMFTSILWKEMRKTVAEGGLVSGGFGEEMFTSLKDQAMAEATSQSGAMGLADMLERQLSPSYPSARTGSGIKAYQTNSLASGEYQLPVEGVVSSSFGERVHPITGELKMHQGLDLAAEEGSAVSAAKGGKVILAGQAEGYGNLVIVEHSDGQQTYYGHLQNILVTQGQAVSAGQQLATVGNTGLSTGPHLHFEIRTADGKAVDPLPLVAKGIQNTT